MSDELTHVVVGDLIGKSVCVLSLDIVTKSLLAAGLGFLSHAMLDKIDNDYTIYWTTKGQLLKDMDYIGIQAGGIGLVFYSVFANEPNPEFKIVRAAAIMGAILPDIIDGVYSFLFPQKWDAKELLFPFHRPDNSNPFADKPQQTKAQSILKGALLSILNYKFRF